MALDLACYATRSGVLELHLKWAREAIAAALPIVERSKSFEARRAAQNMRFQLKQIDELKQQLDPLHAEAMERINGRRLSRGLPPLERGEGL